MLKVKICGLQQPQDAVTAAMAGADFLGLVFVPERRRRLTPEGALEIVEAARRVSGVAPKLVGLFADQPLDEVNGVVDRCGLDMAQLCGGESPEFCASLTAPCIKVVHVAGGRQKGDALKALGERIGPFQQVGCLITLDRLVEGLQGGTGETFDWGIAAEMKGEGYDFILAGGLTPENVGEAVDKARPWGVDVSSGVETDGAKDAEKIRRFVREARKAAAALEGVAGDGG